jgi:thioredoxin
VFEGSAQDFQRLVMDSQVPVVVDVYADWCGPCKQLGPVLETAAMKSGGMFRLVKINSDKNREVAETLGVQGLPSVFAVSKGRVTDKFVGMLPQDQLQTFLVRTITGFGDRVQADQISEQDLDTLSRSLANFAGHP